MRFTNCKWMVLCILALAPSAAADPAPGLAPGLVGEYFAFQKGIDGKDDAVPDGARPFFIRVDKQVNFKEEGGDFHGSKLSDGFLVRWTGVLRITKPGAYRFHTHSDDGSRLYIGDKLVVDNWGPHSMTKKEGTIELAAGDHPIRITYYEGGGGAGCIAGFTPPGGREQVLPGSALFHDAAKAKTTFAAWDKAAWEKVKEPPRQRGGTGDGVEYTRAMGPVVSTALRLNRDERGDNIVYRAIIIPLNDDASAGVVFDADTMRLAGAWTPGNPDGGLTLGGLPFTGGHGQFPSLDSDRGADLLFHLRATPGWAGPDGKLADPREGEYPPLGHLPKDWAHYKGLHVHGGRVALKYTVGDAAVLETPSLTSVNDKPVIIRTLEVKPTGRAMTLVLADAPAAGSRIENGAAVINGSESPTVIAVGGAPAGAKLDLRDGLLVLDLPASRLTTQVAVHFARDVTPDALRKLSTTTGAVDFAALTKPGPAQWTEEIVTQAQLATDREEAQDAYVIDRITVPYGNEYEPRMRIGGMDFFSDGTRAAVSTWDGDVWIVSGITPGRSLGKLEWKRFATGLHEPLGLKIVDDVIYTVDDMQITRFHDYNHDGEADYYENFNNDWELTSGFHAFCFDLHTDPQGNFYFGFGSPVRPGGSSFERMSAHHGSIIKVSKDGSKLQRYATGLRAPNGIGVSPTGQVTSGDNEGTFVPRCPIHWVKEGDFLGVVDSAAPHIREKLNTTATVSQRVPEGKKRTLDPSEMPKPLAWLPKNVDNSGGGQVWVTGDKWGPFHGELLHMSYGTSSLYLVLKEEKAGLVQGGVVKFPLRFTSSAMRARFNPLDGQLYVAGLRGWQSNAAKEGGFDRVRYTGKTVAMPNELRVKKSGVVIGFTQKLDAELANDPDSFAVRASDIRWTQGYGSGEYQIGRREDNSAPQGWTKMEVKSAKLQPDGRSVFVEIENMQPVHQMEISLDLETTDGEVIRTKINNTVHVVK